jgi:hypothetical protein
LNIVKPDDAFNCEVPCQCCETVHNCKLIVLTGGPGAGKTAILESARKILCQHVAILPEAAGIVFGGGFWRLESPTARLASQRAIFHIQEEMENLVLGEKSWGIGLCDRGTLDGLAYWAESEENFWQTFNTTKDKEYGRYQAVIHLRTPTLDRGYNHQNPMRVETSDQAALIDDKIHHVWKNHPNYFEIQSADSFLEKVDNAFEIIKKFMPNCCKEHFES